MEVFSFGNGRNMSKSENVRKLHMGDQAARACSDGRVGATKRDCQRKREREPYGDLRTPAYTNHDRQNATQLTNPGTSAVRLVTSASRCSRRSERDAPCPG